ncbi:MULTISPECIES: hypothetical protein [Streptomyces]|uniref:TetR family transcriptional regulator n=1 Tax=Streptomyces katrae TaxID=68223 RepID=A0ABT7GUG3_9ACTN|nr:MULTISPECIES: hypothetical protein [Streptomyces]MDK9497227.1 hypothetical protein [Streptomyces katrae]GLX21335.1 hypothetical protein Slala01_49790 [Streptomyces lavendulae subsp. lavendulae]GLX27853.1 hypothetical protein Slala02_36730 [Streptomyces lavendulae subsp. lavendulae]
MTIESFFPVEELIAAHSAHGRPASPAPAGTALLGLTAEDLEAYFTRIAEAVEQDDPGPAARGGWEERERLRFSTWVRRVYEHPLSPAVFALPVTRLIREVQAGQAAELAFRIDVGRARAKAAKPSAEVRATAAVASAWAIAADALARSPRPPRERVVGDVWTIVRETIEPALRPAGTFQPRSHSSW